MSMLLPTAYRLYCLLPTACPLPPAHLPTVPTTHHPPPTRSIDRDTRGLSRVPTYDASTMLPRCSHDAPTIYQVSSYASMMERMKAMAAK